jgi:hypothetical protein
MQDDFARLLRDGREDGPPAADVPADLDVDLAAEILVSVVIGAMTHWINDPAYPLEQKLKASLSLLADRLLGQSAAAPAGRKAATTAAPRSPATNTPPNPATRAKTAPASTDDSTAAALRARAARSRHPTRRKTP